MNIKSKFLKWILKIAFWIKSHKSFLIVVLVGVILITGIRGEWLYTKSYMESIVKSISIFTLNTPDVNGFTFFSFITATILVIGGFIWFILKDFINKKLYNFMLKNDNIIIFGFGKINKAFLENLKNNQSFKNKNVIVIDKEEKDFEEFLEKGFLFLKKEINEDFIKSLNLENTTDIVVALGNDVLNMNVGLQILETKKNNKEMKLLIHISKNEMSEFFFDKIDKKDSPINVKFFSFYTEIVDNLFDNHYLDLVPYEYAKLNSDKKIMKMAIIGNSDLNMEIIKRIFMNFIFPNNIVICLFLIDENDKEFKKRVEFETNYSSKYFPFIKLEAKKLTYSLLNDNNFWNNEDLVDIIIGFEDESKNLEIAIDLFEKNFVHNRNYPNIFIAMYENSLLEEKSEKFKNFFEFANIKKVFSVENLLEDETLTIAKKINYYYWKEKKPKDKKEEKCKQKDANELWYSHMCTSYSDRISSIAQADNINFKLLSLGFEKENLDLKKYKEKLDKIKKEYLSKCNANELKIKEITKDEKFFEKFLSSGDFYILCNTEHIRWMAYHIVNNWKYGEKDKDLKTHDCLIDFKDFTKESQESFVYDFNAYYNILKYLKKEKK